MTFEGNSIMSVSNTVGTDQVVVVAFAVIVVITAARHVWNAIK